MGLFLDMLGIAATTSARVEQVFHHSVTIRGGTLVPDDAVDDDLNAVTIAESPQGNVTLVHTGSYTEWDVVAAELSQQLRQPVFRFHIHDGDIWLYTFYVGGILTDSFNPVPAYWSDAITDEERQAQAGNVAVLCANWPKLQPWMIEEYLITWDTELDWERYAYDEDAFPQGDPWQVTDFMAKLGLVYPFDDEQQTSGNTFRLTMPN
jgi:hypothetical protein